MLYMSVAGNSVNRQWYALEIHPKLAPSICVSLAEKGFELLHPTYRVTRYWCDRTAVRELPLFPGYLFARFDANDRWPVVVTPGIKGVVSFGKIPALIPGDEIESIQLALRSGFPLEPHAVPTVGQRVAIRRGPLSGIKGILLDVRKGWRVIVSVPLINQSISIEIDYDALRTLDISEPIPVPIWGDSQYSQRG